MFECKKLNNKLNLKNSLNIILVNKYPIGNYSGLFIPYFMNELPQVLTFNLLKLD